MGACEEYAGSKCNTFIPTSTSVLYIDEGACTKTVSQMHPETMHHAKMAANMAKKFAFEQVLAFSIANNFLFEATKNYFCIG